MATQSLQRRYTVEQRCSIVRNSVQLREFLKSCDPSAKVIAEAMKGKK